MSARPLRTLLWITLAWMLVALAEFGFSYSLLRAMNCPLPEDYVGLMLTVAVMSGLLAGLTGGAITVFLFRKWLRDRPYGEALLRILVAFSLVFILISIVAGYYLYSRELDLPITHTLVSAEVLTSLYAGNTLRTYLFWLLVVLLTNITLLVNEKYGPGVFRDFLLGRYFRPRREERIFMFLDLRGSTTLAEQLGEEAYFRFIQEAFRDLTPAILAHRGQIYQYIGDEIVISWPMVTGLAEGRCIACFPAIQRALRERADHYSREYGCQPEFKAGIHCGPVMAGELGVVKREIAFSGDVLNTTARIQAKCNELGVDLLVSEKLVRGLPAALQAATRRLGAFSLRGKADTTVVYTLK